jgi:hypothetical protein
MNNCTSAFYAVIYVHDRWRNPLRKTLCIQHNVWDGCTYLSALVVVCEGATNYVEDGSVDASSWAHYFTAHCGKMHNFGECDKFLWWWRFAIGVIIFVVVCAEGMSLGSVVGIATACGLDDWGDCSRILTFADRPDRLWCAPNLLSNG